MPDDLYDRDILIWSEHQADLLRRLARGERVNDVDWEHVAEEIEDVGRSEWHSVESLLRQMLVHLLKVHGWPESVAGQHWWSEIVGFQQEASDRFAPSMRQRIEVARLYTGAIRRLAGETYDGQAPKPWPTACPFTLDELLTEDRATLEAILRSATPPES